MPNAFNFSASPFDCLSTDEQALVRSNVDIALSLQPQAVVLGVGARPLTCSSLSKATSRKWRVTRCRPPLARTIALR